MSIARAPAPRTMDTLVARREALERRPAGVPALAAVDCRRLVLVGEGPVSAAAIGQNVDRTKNDNQRCKEEPHAGNLQGADVDG